MYLSLRKRLLAAANTVSNSVGDDVGARVRMRLALAIALAVTIGATIIEIPIGQAAVYYVDVKILPVQTHQGLEPQRNPIAL